ncbi:DNA replication and repair protein RecN [Desulfocapsa sulfexigens DSM 10523]|uniref:DNA repair protein RecN n=1 Tax=Desulfocapsa sulfexigens (strain DSM 10523 / SB164P1) TaxID=1167006 RepID=M1NH50_DESSD|nr:DNA repair protein RecN [Desulfocapsa sulfexigens]AGF78939.1 DNA replication and repair protein RecN [Desulfocapsa sulfexigens DSM 10523]
MLCELKIDNLALIESLHLDLCCQNGNGLVVMTGETGAGKSIMLRAIHLLTGGRASADWIRNGAECCTVEALFEVSQNNQLLQEIFAKQGIDAEETLVMKRVVTNKGRSRMYINGSPATTKMAAELAVSLLNVASQHDHQQLLQPWFHLDFLDTMGETWPLRKQFDLLFGRWQGKRDELEQLQKQEQEKEQRRDFLQYQLEEIRAIEPIPGEDELLAEEKKRLKSADTLIKISRKSHGLMEQSLLDGLIQIRMDMSQAAELDGDAKELATELAEFSYHAEDLVLKLREYRDSLNNDPYRLDTVNERLNELQGLKRKYGDSLEAVIAFAEDAEAQLQQIENLEKVVSGCEAEVLALESELCLFAGKLSEKRKKTAVTLEQSMGKELESLAFNQSGLEVRFQEHGENVAALRQGGWDKVEFFFSANPGEPVRPLVKVASGGELSRLMLAFKCLLARKDMVETVIFDEVDAGIGGEAAEAVARKIQELSTHHQVFCITHLPQIAARGNTHFLVEKGVEDGRTQSGIYMLTPEQRLNEVSRMLAGESVSDQTRAWAEELLAKGRGAA